MKLACQFCTFQRRLSRVYFFRSPTTSSIAIHFSKKTSNPHQRPACRMENKQQIRIELGLLRTGWRVVGFREWTTKRMPINQALVWDPLHQSLPYLPSIWPCKWCNLQKCIYLRSLLIVLYLSHTLTSREQRHTPTILPSWTMMHKLWKIVLHCSKYLVYQTVC